MQVSTTQLASEVGGPIQAQVLDPAIFVDAPAYARASAMFVVVFLVGGVLLQRREGFVDHSVSATLSHPLRSLGYGIVTHGVFGFATVYLGTQLALVEVAGVNFGPVGLLVGAVLVGASGSVGFTVVGVAVSDVWGSATGWPGVALGGALAGGVASLELLPAGILWVAVVSIGIGGAVREWLQASAQV